MALGVRRELLARCLLAPALRSSLKVLSAGWLHLPRVDLNQSVLIQLSPAMRPHGLLYSDLRHLRLVVKVLLEFVGALGRGDAAAWGWLVGLGGEGFEVLLKIAHLTVIIKIDKYDKKGGGVGRNRRVEFSLFLYNRCELLSNFISVVMFACSNRRMRVQDAKESLHKPRNIKDP